jgi:hypothetical protein
VIVTRAVDLDPPDPSEQMPAAEVRRRRAVGLAGSPRGVSTRDGRRTHGRAGDTRDRDGGGCPPPRGPGIGGAIRPLVTRVCAWNRSDAIAREPGLEH